MTKVVHLLVLSGAWGMQMWVTFISGRDRGLDIMDARGGDRDERVLGHVLTLVPAPHRLCAFQGLPGIPSAWCRANSSLSTFTSPWAVPSSTSTILASQCTWAQLTFWEASQVCGLEAPLPSGHSFQDRMSTYDTFMTIKTRPPKPPRPWCTQSWALGTP